MLSKIVPNNIALILSRILANPIVDDVIDDIDGALARITGMSKWRVCYVVSYYL